MPPFELKLHLISSKSSPPTPYPKSPHIKTMKSSLVSGLGLALKPINHNSLCWFFFLDLSKHNTCIISNNYTLFIRPTHFWSFNNTSSSSSSVFSSFHQLKRSGKTLLKQEKMPVRI